MDQPGDQESRSGDNWDRAPAVLLEVINCGPGAGGNVRSFCFGDLQALAPHHQAPDVSRYVPHFGGAGVFVRGILEAAGIPEQTSHVTFHSNDGGFSASVELLEVLAKGILIYALEGRPLQQRFGGPLRLVIPGSNACANVKHVTRLELSQGKGRDTTPAGADCAL
ncbi:MAG: molybdopterin-dependent oxidoreductase [Candidatus Tectomicrobia bacterium]|nr:molybdopterin-dependent oxidoreductase [Candidatus Tectomicrobia bacterium]